MGAEARLHTGRRGPTESTAPREADEALAVAESLGRLMDEAVLLERLLSHIGEQRDQARGAHERLARRCAKMPEADRAVSEALVGAEAAMIESRLTRLRTAASLAREIAEVGVREAEALKGRAACPGDSGVTGSASVDAFETRPGTRGRQV